MRIVRMRLDEIEDAHYNPRKPLTPDDPEWRQIEASIEQFGLVEPLVYNKTTGRLVGGHQRKKILAARGETHAHVSVVEIEDEAAERALNIALNRGGDWDMQMLAAVLEGLRDTSYVTATGFDEEAIAALLEENRAAHAGDFLNDLTGGGGAGVGDDAEAAPAMQERPAQHYQLGFSLLAEQRDVVQEALAREKRRAGGTSVDAFVRVCQHYLDTIADG